MRCVYCWLLFLVLPISALGAPITAIGFVENVSTGATRLAFLRGAHGWRVACFFEEAEDMLKRQTTLTDNNEIQTGWSKVLNSGCADALLKRDWTVLEQDRQKINVGHLNNTRHVGYSSIGLVNISASARAKLKQPFQMNVLDNKISSISNLLIAVPEGTTISEFQDSYEPKLSKSIIRAIKDAYLEIPRAIAICDSTTGAESSEHPATLRNLKVTPYLKYRNGVTFAKVELVLAT